MKIKISKSQWEDIGNKTGWIKSAQNTPLTPEEQQLEKNMQQELGPGYSLLKMPDGKYNIKPKHSPQQGDIVNNLNQLKSLFEKV